MIKHLNIKHLRTAHCNVTEDNLACAITSFFTQTDVQNKLTHLMLNMSFSIQYLIEKRTTESGNKVLVQYTQKLQASLCTSD